MALSNTILWAVIVALVVFIAYSMCDRQKQAELRAGVQRLLGGSQKQVPMIQDPDTEERLYQLQSSQIKNRTLLEVEHSDPLLLTLFTREVEELPEGVSQEEFDAMVKDYQDKHLKTPEVQIPRSLNYNYEKRTHEQEEMERANNRQYQQFVQRDSIGSLSERGLQANTPQLHVKSFHKKKVAKR